MKHQTETVHPELQSIAKLIPQMTFSAKNLWLRRFMGGLRLARTKCKDIRVENIFIPRPGYGKQIRLRRYRPQGMVAPAPALVWMHGGGYILGIPEQDDPACIRFARELGITIVSVDYRYAPEHPFPDPLDDCYAALMWVDSHAGQLGIDAQRIAIGGASAGGGLAAALGQLALDREEVRVVFQLLVYPMLDDRTSIRSDLVDQAYYAWNQASNRFGWEAYLGMQCGGADIPVYAVPSRREDLSGLAPAWIGVGTLDLFYDEDVAYGQKLRDCGVACETVIVPGAFHGFDVFGIETGVVNDFRNSQIAALKRYLF